MYPDLRLAMSASAAAHNKLKRKRGVAEDAGPGLSAGLTRRSWSTTEVVDVDALSSVTAESRNAGTQKRVRTKKGRAQAANRPEASNRPAAAVANRGTQLAGPVAPVTQGKSIASAIPISDESDEDGVWAVGRETFEPRRRAKRAPPVTGARASTHSTVSDLPFFSRYWRSSSVVRPKFGQGSSRLERRAHSQLRPSESTRSTACPQH